MLVLLGWIVLTAVAAAIAAIASTGAPAFYARLVRPSWAPAAAVFAPVWTVLYVLMAIAAWRVSRARGGWLPLTLFVVQLGVNALWSWLFFVWRHGALALADIVLLWLLVAATIAAFWRVSRVSAILLLPYLAWITFAGLLCYRVWRANPQALG
jgi:tryptophan-rich sensory protein